MPETDASSGLNRRLGWIGLSAALWTGLAAVPLAAQGTVTGIIRDDSTRAPLAGVEVLVVGTRRRAETDSTGVYRISGVSKGSRQLQFRLIGYLPMQTDVLFRDGETAQADGALIRRPVVLDPITVRGRVPEPRGGGLGREALERRRALGFGRFIDSAEVRRFEHRQIRDLLRQEVGIELRRMRLRGGSVLVALNRTRSDVFGAPDCLMQIFYDGMALGRGGMIPNQNTPIYGGSEIDPFDLSSFTLSEIHAVEIYRTAGEIPPEFSGPNSGCGVIAVWSRRAP